MIHVEPLNDLITHLDHDCPCGPDVEYIDPYDGSYHHDPLVVHHSLDGRELHEP